MGLSFPKNKPAKFSENQIRDHTHIVRKPAAFEICINIKLHFLSLSTSKILQIKN